jgi:hypothetical protein
MALTKPNRLEKMVRAAGAAGIAIPAFNIPYLPMASAVADALRRNDAFGLM